mmetsp:Transcript_92674/g.265638  ORF Transcript_92674/g.265638 Transcript_92674/m.265638 type:complete len:250 (-) Transcript_92674:891-1640(-)
MLLRVPRLRLWDHHIGKLVQQHDGDQDRNGRGHGRRNQTEGNVFDHASHHPLAQPAQTECESHRERGLDGALQVLNPREVRRQACPLRVHRYRGGHGHQKQEADGPRQQDELVLQRREEQGVAGHRQQTVDDREEGDLPQQEAQDQAHALVLGLRNLVGPLKTRVLQQSLLVLSLLRPVRVRGRRLAAQLALRSRYDGCCTCEGHLCRLLFVVRCVRALPPHIAPVHPHADLVGDMPQSAHASRRDANN